MKYRNIIALCLGLFTAALLWKYYLWPKYQIKSENPSTMALIEEIAQKELENSIDSTEPGEVLFVGDKINGEEELIGESLPKIIKEEDFVFDSQANRPKDVFDLISKEEIKKYRSVPLDKEDFVLNPSSVNKEQEDVEMIEDTSRITMLKLPEEFAVIKDKEAYKNFLKEHKGDYPEIDFAKEILLAVLSASKVSDSFFEIIKAEMADNEIQVFYRVNLIAPKDDKLAGNYKIIDKTDLPIKFIQVK